MKKFLLVVAVAGIMTSCKDKKKTEETTTTTPTTEQPTTPTTTEPTTTAPTTSGVPSFSDADVAAYVNSYEEYISALTKAVDSKDMSKLAELGPKAQDLAAKGLTASKKLMSSPEDAKKLADYMSTRGAEAAALMKKLTGQ